MMSLRRTSYAVVLVVAAVSLARAEVTPPEAYQATRLGFLEGHASAVQIIELSTSGPICASVDSANQLHVWDLSKRTSRAQLKEGLPPEITSLALSRDGRIMAVAGGAAAVQVWDLGTQERIRELEVATPPVTHVAILGDADFVAASDQKGRVYRWSLNNPDDSDHFDNRVQSSVWAVSADHQTLYFRSNATSDVHVWTLGSDRPAKLEMAGVESGGVRMLFPTNEKMTTAVSDDRRYLAIRSSQGMMVAQDPAVAGSFWQKAVSSKFPNLQAIGFSPRAEFLVIYGGGGSYQVRQVDTDALHVNAGPRFPENVTCARLWLGDEPGDDWLGLSGESDGRIGVWKLQPPQQPPVTSKMLYVRRIYELLEKADFDSLENLAQQARKAEDRFFYDGGHQLGVFYASVLAWGQQAEWDQRLDMIDKWKAAQPDSTVPGIAEAAFWNAYAWEARGTGFANTVSEEQWQLFRERLQKARAALEQAQKLGAVDSDLYRLQVDLAKTDLRDPAEFMRAVAASVKLDPLYSPTYESAVEFLLPRWHGGPDSVARFATAIANLIGGEDGDAMYARMVQRAFYYEQEEVFVKLGLEYERFKKGIVEVRKRYPMSDYWVSLHLRLAHAGGDKETCLEIIDHLDNRIDPTVFSSVGQISQIHRWAKIKPDPRLIHQLRAHSREVWGVGWLKEDSELVSFAHDGNLKRWDPETGNLLGTITSQTANEGVKMAVAADGTSLVLSYNRSSDRHAYVEYLQLEDRQLVSKGSSQTLRPARDLALSADGGTAVATFSDGRISVYSRPEMLKRVRLKHDADLKFSSVEISPDGETIWTGGSQLRRWNRSGELMETLDEPGGPFVNSKGTSLALVRGQDKELHLFSTDPWSKRLTLEFRTPIYSLGFSKDGKLYAAGFIDVVALLDAANDELVHLFQDPQLGFVLSVSFSHDGKRLAAASSQGLVSIWDVSEFLENEGQ